MNLYQATEKKLNGFGYVTRFIDIKRAYWRHSKQRNGFSVPQDTKALILSDYLILNRLAKPAYKFQKQSTKQNEKF